MIFIKFNEKNIITYINYMPFDEQFGTKLTEEQMKLQGALVNEIPIPKTEKEYIHKYDIETNTVYCEFIQNEKNSMTDRMLELEKQNAQITYTLMENNLI